MQKLSDEGEGQEMGHGVIHLWLRLIRRWMERLHLTGVSGGSNLALFQGANKMCNQETGREKGRGRESGRDESATRAEDTETAFTGRFGCKQELESREPRMGLQGQQTLDTDKEPRSAGGGGHVG